MESKLLVLLISLIVLMSIFIIYNMTKGSESFAMSAKQKLDAQKANQKLQDAVYARINPLKTDLTNATSKMNGGMSWMARCGTSLSGPLWKTDPICINAKKSIDWAQQIFDKAKQLDYAKTIADGERELVALQNAYRNIK